MRSDIGTHCQTEASAREKASTRLPLKRRVGRKRCPRRWLPQASEASSTATRCRAAKDEGSSNYVIFDDADVSIEQILQSRQAKGAPRKPIGKAGVEAAIAPIVDSWKSKGAPKVEVLESAAELPQVAKDHLARTPGVGSVDGLFHVGADTVYLIGDQIRNAEQARRVLAHEVVGHHSMMQMLGDEFPAVVRDVTRLINRKAPAVKRIADQVRRDYGDGISQDELATETIAHMAEQGVRHPVMKRAIAQVRRFLRGLGFRLSFNVAEVEDMISRASDRLKKPTTQPVPKKQQIDPDDFGTPAAMADGPGSANVIQAQDRFLKSVAGQHNRRRFYPVDRMFRLMMLPVGGVNENGEWKYAPKIQAAGRKLIREAKPNPDGPFGFTGPFIEAARSGWLNRYGTPEDFVMRERQAAVDKFRIEQEGVALVKALGDEIGTIEEAQALQDVLEGKPLDDQRMKGLAEPVREALDKYGKELVDLGLLSKDTYLKNLGEWVHRSYLQYEQADNSLIRWGRQRGKKRRQALIGDQLKMRGKVHKPPPMERLLKDVPQNLKDQARKAKNWGIFDQTNDDGRITRRVYWPDGMQVPKGEVWDKGGAWADRGKWEMLIAKGRKPLLRQDYTDEERAEMGEIRDARYNVLKSFHMLAHDIAQGRLFKDIAEQPAWFSQEKPEDGMIIEPGMFKSANPYYAVGWVQVPDTLIGKSDKKRWGALAGGYIRAPIWRDMAELEKMQNPGAWGWMLREYKLMKTARSPGVHFNNVMSNVILADLHDLTAGDLTAAIMEFANKGKFYEEAIEQGIFSGGFVRNELITEQIADALRKSLKAAESQATPKTNLQETWQIFKAAGGAVAGADRAVRSAYQFEDEIFRLTTYIRDRTQGETPGRAAQNAIDRFLNYDIRAPWPNALRRSVFPFFAYTYASVPQIMKAAVARPWKLAKLFTLGYVLNELSYEITGGDEEKDRAVMAERDSGYTWVGLPRLLRLPMLGRNDDPLYLDLRRIIPGGGMLETDVGPAGLPEFLLIGGPLSMAADVLWNRVAFSGEDIVNREIDTFGEATEKTAAYLWRAAMPNLPFLPGTWSYKRLNQAIGDERDIFGRQYSIPIAMIKSFGPNIKPQDPEYQYMMRQFDFRREMKELKRRMYQISSDRSRGRISKERFRRELKDFQGRMQELSERKSKLDREFRGRPGKK